MKIQLVSDLHLEFSDVEIANQNNADVLILGGDIMIAQNLHEFKEDDPVLPMNFTNRGKAERFRNFLKRVSAKFPHVIYIAGNHEFYHGKFPAGYDWLKEECSRFYNIHFLEMSTVDIGDVTFAGATLWTDMNKGNPVTMETCRSQMNDYHVIRNNEKNYSKLIPLNTLSRHRKTIEWLDKVIKQDPNRKYVVVGHHSPSKLSTKPKYKDDFHLNGAYSSDLSEFILDNPQIKVWTHGHTHDCFDYYIGNTRIVCNPRGYEGYEPDSGWDPNFAFEV